jgi:hypothetical protein
MSNERDDLRDRLDDVADELEEPDIPDDHLELDLSVETLTEDDR